MNMIAQNMPRGVRINPFRVWLLGKYEASYKRSLETMIAEREAKVGKRKGTVSRYEKGVEVIVKEWPWPVLEAVNVPTWLVAGATVNIDRWPVEVLCVDQRMCLVKDEWLERAVDTAEIVAENTN